MKEDEKVPEDPVYYSSKNGASISFTLGYPPPPVYYSSKDGMSVSFWLPTAGSADLSGSFTVRQPGSKNLSSNITVRNVASADLNSSALIMNAATKDLSSNFAVLSPPKLSSSFTIRKTQSVPGLFTVFVVRNAGTKDLRCSITIKNKGSKALSSNFFVPSVFLPSSFWVSQPTYAVERISHNITQKECTPISIATGVSYATVLEEDVVGYTTFSALIAAGTPNAITYRIQATSQKRPGVWAGIPNQVDVDVSASDPENMGTAATFTGSFERIRIQAKQKTAAGRAWASLRATRGV